MMRSVLSTARRRPGVVYFVLAYALAWVLYPLIAVNQLFGLLGLFAPAAAAVIASAWIGGRAEVRALLRRLTATAWRVGWVWYAVALGLPVLLSLAILGIAILRGAPAAFQISPISPLLLVVFVLVVGEELGWRGFAQPALERTRSPVIAALIVGVLWGLWHLPTFILPGMPQEGIPLPAFLIFTTAASVVLAWLMRRANGSVVIATLFHGAFNTFGVLTPSLSTAERWWLTAIVYSLAAAIVLLLVPGMVGRPAIAGGSVAAAD